ncbi:MAG: NADH-quinone oxidoreductase subunit N [Candidatus Kapabacteria bacterium]|nr:NADH-quinone oxidoreductase subunit N [Candidatus Kapabacteria bacterium]
MEYILASPLISILFFSVFIPVVDGITKNRTTVFVLTLLGLIITGILAIYTLLIPVETIQALDSSKTITKNMIMFGGFSAYFDILFCLAGILVILASRNYLNREYGEYKEYYSLIVASICGMILIAHSNNLLVLFIGIETMSIPFYILAGFFRTNQKSIEASIKYFLLGAFSTGFLVYGIAMVYGATGSLDISIISSKIQTGQAIEIYLKIGLALLIIGLCFKVAIFPFHQWAPDVYDGSPTVVSAFMSTAGKAAALVGFIIIAKGFLPKNSFNEVSSLLNTNFKLILAILSAITMIIGNITALVQKNVKRMLAYSSVAHAGYLLMGIASNNQDGWSGIIFYSTAYLFMQIGAFIVVSVLERQTENFVTYEEYSGIHKSHPFLAAVMSMFMLSLAGIPPFAGFFGKYYLFVAAVKADLLWLTVIAVIASIISMYFYIGLILQMYFKEPLSKEPESDTGLAKITLVISAAGILFFGIFPQIIVNFTENLFK